jgi:Spy/CpxP family protein refolding chaperone
MRKFVGGAAAALALVAGFVVLTGFHGGCGSHASRDPAQMAAFVSARVDDLLDDVDATPAQRTQVNAVKDRLLEAAQKAHAGQDQARAAALAEWKAETPDAAKLHKLVDARIDEMRAFAHQAVDGAVEVHGVLNAQQRAKLTKKIERWHR